LFVTIVKAQNTINGTVVDRQSKAPVQDASIIVEGSNINTTTDEYGKFNITSSAAVKS